MSSIPLYLKIKSPQREEKALFETVGDRSIVLNDKQYDFTKIYTGSNNTYEELVNTSDSCASYIFMGPTGSGKTTTLKQVIYEKIYQLEASGAEATITAFEVSENRYITDLLETPAKKKEYHSSFFESQLHKARLNCDAHEIIGSVFRKRSTKKTTFNHQSSRSCLVVTLFYNGTRINYIDLMGNEKYDKTLSLSNAFANTNMSSITQLLANKRSANGRSSNLITNLIFNDMPNPGNINIILNVDPHGDLTLLKSIFNNIASLVKGFRLENTSAGKLEDTPRIPHYARPTISSMSPTRIIPTMSPLRKLSSTPSKFKMIPNSNMRNTAPKLMGSRSIQKFLTPTRNAFVSPMKSSLPCRSSHLTKNFYDIQISSLKKTICEFESAISDFRQEHRSILQSFSDECNIESSKCDVGKISFKAELDDLIKIKDSNEKLLMQKNVLQDKVNDFKIDFYKFKEQHSNFSGNINTLRKSLDSFKSENSELIVKNKELIEELNSMKKKLEKLELEDSDLMNRYDALTSKNNTLTLDLQGIKEENERKETLINDKQASIDKLMNENRLLVTETQKMDDMAKLIKELKQSDKENKQEIELSVISLKEKQKQLELKDNIIDKTKKELSELTASVSTSLDNQRIVDSLRLELSLKKSEVEQLTSENKLISDKHSKSIEELKTYKYKFKTLNNSWTQKFDKLMKSKDQGILKLQSELNAQNAKQGNISNNISRKFLGSDIFQDNPNTSQPIPVSKKNLLQPSNTSNLDNQANKATCEKGETKNISSKVKKNKKKKNHKNASKLQLI